MTRFIWIRDIDKIDHYINVNHIIRVTKIPAHASFSAKAYLVLHDNKDIVLSNENFDTADDVISKIQVAMS
jgi:hypothetical protein